MCGSVLDSPVVCGDALDKSTVCGNVLDSSYSKISMTEGGNIPSSSYGNAVVAVCGNDDSTVCHLASVNSSFVVNDPLEACTSASDDSVKAACPLADIGHPAVDSSVSTLPNAMARLVCPLTRRMHLIAQGMIYRSILQKVRWTIQKYLAQMMCKL